MARTPRKAVSSAAGKGRTRLKARKSGANNGRAPKSEDMMTERRKYLRFEAPVGVEYKTLTLNPIFGKALAKDLSREGVRMGLKQSVPVGTSVEIRLNVPGDNLPVFATGKVAWADGLDAGIKLTKIDHADRARMLEYVYREWLKNSSKPSSR